MRAISEHLHHRYHYQPKQEPPSTSRQMNRFFPLPWVWSQYFLSADAQLLNMPKQYRRSSSVQPDDSGQDRQLAASHTRCDRCFG